jgi:hypothetical protein
MPRLTLLPLFLPALGLAAAAAAPASPPPLERLPLFVPAELKQWSTAESRVAVADATAGEAAGALQWSVVVDHTTGEPKYPIGWPRVNRSFPAGPLRDWSGWDYLECHVLVRTNRESLPAIPAGLGLHTPDRAGAFQRSLTELRANTWVPVRIPIPSIPRHHDVRQIQFHIAEQNYRHGDRLDVSFRDLALVRHATPTVLSFAADSAAAFTDARGVPLRLHVAGVAAGRTTEAVCHLEQAGRVVARQVFPVARGLNAPSFRLASGTLPAGDYAFSVQLGDSAPPVRVPLRLVDSPWKGTP